MKTAAQLYLRFFLQRIQVAEEQNIVPLDAKPAANIKIFVRDNVGQTPGLSNINSVVLNYLKTASLLSFEKVQILSNFCGLKTKT